MSDPVQSASTQPASTQPASTQPSLKKYLFYIRTSFQELRIFSVETDDFLHCIGYLYWHGIGSGIERVDVVKYTEERVKFWKENGYTIVERNDLNTKKDVY